MGASRTARAVSALRFQRFACIEIHARSPAQGSACSSSEESRPEFWILPNPIIFQKTEQNPTKCIDKAPIIDQTIRMDAILTPFEPVLQSAVIKAIATLTAILDDTAAPAAQKIRAACTILRISATLSRHREDPGRSRAPRADPPMSAASSAGVEIDPTARNPPRPQPEGAPTTPSIPVPSISARLEGLAAPLIASTISSSRATSLIASAGVSPLSLYCVPTPPATLFISPRAKAG